MCKYFKKCFVNIFCGCKIYYNKYITPYYSLKLKNQNIQSITFVIICVFN